jgi:hypothetical protein
MSILYGKVDTSSDNQSHGGMEMAQPFVESNCAIEHEGKSFTANGAFVSDTHIVAYLGKDNVLTDWHGNPLGTYRIVSTWKTPRSYVSGTMHAVHARIDGYTYKGRSAGVGMSFSGKIAASSQGKPSEI